MQPNMSDIFFFHSSLFCYKHSLIYKRDQSARGRFANRAEQEDPLQNEMPEPAVTLDTGNLVNRKHLANARVLVNVPVI